MTTSTSSAPSLIVDTDSIAFTVDLLVPCGNPATVHVSTPLPLSSFATVGTHAGATHTDANLCSSASEQIFCTSCERASGLSTVWSIFLANSAGVISLTFSGWLDQPQPVESFEMLIID